MRAKRRRLFGKHLPRWMKEARSDTRVEDAFIRRSWSLR